VLKGSFQLCDQVTSKITGDLELEIRSEFPAFMTVRYQFDSIDILNDFVMRMKKSIKTHHRLMQSTLTEIAIKRILCTKYNFKNSKLTKKHFWFSPDLNEIRWASSKNAKKYSKVDINEIKDIKLGPNTKNFKKVLDKYGAKNIPYHLCFSICTNKKTIDLQAGNEAEFKLLIQGIMYVIRTKCAKIPGYIPMNKLPFVSFRLKMTKSAHLVGYTFLAYLKIKLFKIAHEQFSLSSSKLQKVPILNIDSSRTNADRSKRIFIHHKRNSTLSNYQNSFEDQYNQYFNPNPSQLFTDRRGTNIDYSRNNSSGGSSASIQYPLSHRMDSVNYSTVLNQSQHRSSHPNILTSNMTVPERDSSLKRNNHSYSIPNRRSDFTIYGSYQNPAEMSDLNIRRLTSPTASGIPRSGSGLQLYYNMDGSKDYSSVLNQQYEQSPYGTKLLPENLAIDVTKINSPQHNISALHNYSNRSEDFNAVLNKLSSTKIHGTPENLYDEFDDKENISPNNTITEKKMKQVRPMVTKLNLKNVLRDRTNLPEHLEYNDKEYFNSIQTVKPNKMPSSTRENSLTKPINIVGPNSTREGTPSEAQLNQTKSKYQKPHDKSFTITEKSEKSLLDESSQSMNKNQKRKVKLTIDKNALKAKFIEALQNSQTPQNNQNSSNLINQSFAYENIPANLSIDVSKIDFNFDLVNKSRISQNDEKDQHTSRFRNELSIASSNKKNRHYHEDLHKDNRIVENKEENEEKTSRNNTLDLTQTEAQEENKPRGTSERKKTKKVNLTLDTEAINLESEISSLKEQVNDLTRERDLLRENCSQWEAEYNRFKQQYSEEIQIKSDTIDDLYNRLKAVEAERDEMKNKLTQTEERVTFLEKKESELISKAEASEQRLHEELAKAKVEMTCMKRSYQTLMEQFEKGQKENLYLRNENHRQRELYNKLQEQKQALEKKITPKVTLDLSNLNKVKTLSNENKQLKQVLRHKFFIIFLGFRK